MIILAADRELVMDAIARTDIPGLTFLILRAGELLRRTNPGDVAEGRKQLLAAAHRADEINLKLTALVELEARGRKDPE